MPSALITGITGQDGHYLAEFLTSKGYEVHGLVRDPHGMGGDVVREIAPSVQLHHGDLTDLPSLVDAVRESEADEVYNLAAVSFVARSWEQAHLTTEVTAKGVLNILEAVRLSCGNHPGRIRFYQASSSEMFGKAQASPQTEDTRFWPRSPYGVSKVYGHHLTVNYRESYGMHASCGILFNHESPRRGPEFVTRKISRAAARIALGLQDELVLGMLSARRDWGFAGDFVEAMWLMLQQDEPGDYVVATGETHSVREFVDTAFRRVGIEHWGPLVRTDESLRRPAEVDPLVGDSSKAREVLGWKPRIGFTELVHMMVDADLARESDRARHQRPAAGAAETGV